VKCNHRYCALDKHEGNIHRSGRGRNFTAPTPDERARGTLSTSELVAFYMDENGRLGVGGF